MKTTTGATAPRRGMNVTVQKGPRVCRSVQNTGDMKNSESHERGTGSTTESLRNPIACCSYNPGLVVDRDLLGRHRKQLTERSDAACARNYMCVGYVYRPSPDFDKEQVERALHICVPTLRLRSLWGRFWTAVRPLTLPPAGWVICWITIKMNIEFASPTLMVEQ